MNKKTILILAITVIMVLIRNYGFDKKTFVPSPAKVDTLTANTARIVENRIVNLYSKKDSSSARIVQVEPGDTVILSAISGDWCRISSKKQEGFSPAAIVKTYSSLPGTPTWKIWLKHNYKGDKWQFWVLNIVLLLVLIGLRPVFSAFDQTILKFKDFSVSKHSNNKVMQFFLESLVPDFRSFYKNCIVGGVLVIIVAIVSNNAYLSMIEYKLPYLMYDSQIYGMALFAIMAFISVALAFEIAGGFLYYGYVFGGLRSIALLLSSPVIIGLTIALVIPVLLVLTALFLLKALAKVDPVGFSSKANTASEETHLSVCPACGGAGKTGTGIFAGCSMCCGQGRLKYNSKGEMKGRVW